MYGNKYFSFSWNDNFNEKKLFDDTTVMLGFGALDLILSSSVFIKPFCCLLCISYDSIHLFWTITTITSFIVMYFKGLVLFIADKHLRTEKASPLEAKKSRVLMLIPSDLPVGRYLSKFLYISSYFKFEILLTTTLQGSQ